MFKLYLFFFSLIPGFDAILYCHRNCLQHISRKSVRWVKIKVSKNNYKCDFMSLMISKYFEK